MAPPQTFWATALKPAYILFIHEKTNTAFCIWEKLKPSKEHPKNLHNTFVFSC